MFVVSSQNISFLRRSALCISKTMRPSSRSGSTGRVPSPSNAPHSRMRPQSSHSHRSGGPSSVICRYYTNRSCRFGDECKYAHPASNATYEPVSTPHQGGDWNPYIRPRRDRDTRRDNYNRDNYHYRESGDRVRERERERDRSDRYVYRDRERSRDDDRDRNVNYDQYHRRRDVDVPPPLYSAKHGTHPNHTHHSNSSSGDTSADEMPHPPQHARRSYSRENNGGYHNRQSNVSYHQRREYRGEFRSSTHNSNHLERQFIDSRLPCIVFDIDGTLADIEPRLQLAPASRSDGTRTAEEWNLVLDGEYYYMDRVIEVTRAYLWYLQRNNRQRYNVLYLSGRRSKTMQHTRYWLFDTHDFPKGFIIHRRKGIDSRTFKEDSLRKLAAKYNIAAYFGDRFIDDCVYCIRANVRPLLVIPNQWIYGKHLKGGLSAVMEELLKDESNAKRWTPELIEYARKSIFWDMPYSDLIPPEYTTDQFAIEKGKGEWPPFVVENQLTEEKIEHYYAMQKQMTSDDDDDNDIADDMKSCEDDFEGMRTTTDHVPSANLTSTSTN